MSQWLAAAVTMPVSDLRSTAAVVAKAYVLEVALRTLPFSRLVALLGISTTQGSSTPVGTGVLRLSVAERRRLRAIARVMARWRLARGTCLRAALLSAHALRDRAPTVLIGVRHEANGIRGHAWVEVDGVALAGHEGYLTLHGPARSAA